MTTGNKFHKDKFFTKIEHTASSGVVGELEYEVFGEVKLKVLTTFTTSGTLTIQGRIKESSTWETVGTLTSGGDSDSFDIDTFDYIRFNFTVAAGSTGEIAASGFFKAASSGGGGAAFLTMQTDAGTNPVATGADTLTLTSSDSSLTITGDATTDTVDMTVAAIAAAGSDGQVQYNNSTVRAGSSIYWDDTNSRMGVLTSSPVLDFELGDGTSTSTRKITINRSSGNYVRLSCISGGHEVESTQPFNVKATTSLKLVVSNSTKVYLTTTGAAFFNGGTLPANNRIYIKGAGTSTDATLHCVDSGGTTVFKAQDDGVVNMPGLPTSAAGLNTGDLWNNSGVINIA